MLSGETSVGQHPVQVIEYMCRIIETVEQGAEGIYYRERAESTERELSLSDSLCYMAGRAAKYVHAQGIVGLTRSGYTAYQVASYRPHCSVFIFTPDPRLLTRISLLWGVRAFFYDKQSDTNQTIDEVLTFLKEHKLVRKGDVVVNTGAMPVGSDSRANFLKISKIYFILLFQLSRYKGCHGGLRSHAQRRCDHRSMSRMMRTSGRVSRSMSPHAFPTR
jgi:pyruvate kinase